MELFEVETETTGSREEIAAALVKLADQLARHNSLEFKRDGIRYTVKVPDTLEIEVELEIKDDGGSLEIELSW